MDSQPSLGSRGIEISAFDPLADARCQHVRAPTLDVLTGSVEVGAGWLRRSEMSGKDCVSLALAAPEFGPRRGRRCQWSDSWDEARSGSSVADS
jgi:uncharacterized protein (DUF736 family)